MMVHSGYSSSLNLKTNRQRSVEGVYCIKKKKKKLQNGLTGAFIPLNPVSESETEQHLFAIWFALFSHCM